MGRGTYGLLMQLERQVTLTVGRLGMYCCPPGYYLYVGSALGSGGLEARLARHLRREKRRFWHIDYFLDMATVIEVWQAATEGRWECRWAQAALMLPGRSVPLPRFGASDCRCPAHLVHWTARPCLTEFASLLPELDIQAREPGPVPGA